MGQQVTFLYTKLLAYYGWLNWWPAKTPYEVIVGAVLTQNTSWNNVEQALKRMGEARLNPNIIERVNLAQLKEWIRPAGFFNQKALYLKAVTAWFANYQYHPPTVRQQSLPHLRAELLTVKGVGPETADTILLYAFHFTTFVIDAYTLRLCERIPVLTDKTYAGMKAHFESQLPSQAQLFNNYHALIVTHAKTFCRKKPICKGCPLLAVCKFGQADFT